MGVRACFIGAFCGVLLLCGVAFFHPSNLRPTDVFQFLQAQTPSSNETDLADQAEPVIATTVPTATQNVAETLSPSVPEFSRRPSDVIAPNVFRKRNNKRGSKKDFVRTDDEDAVPVAVPAHFTPREKARVAAVAYRENTSRVLLALARKQQSAVERCGPLNKEPWRVEDELSPSFCESISLRPRPLEQLPKIYYAVMVGFEIDMLDILFYEIFPVVDYILVVESQRTHALKSKPLLFNKSRYPQYASKIRYVVYSPSHARYNSGWDIERRQRTNMLQKDLVEGIADGDIFVGNGDLDEIMSRRLLLKWKYCLPPPSDKNDRPFALVHFRYNFGCLQSRNYTVYYRTVFAWESRLYPRDYVGAYLNPYDRRKSLAVRHPPGRPFKVDGYESEDARRGDADGGVADAAGLPAYLDVQAMLAWHFSGFGGIEAIMQKHRHSPHRHLGQLTRQEVQRYLDSCFYSGLLRYNASLPLKVLPLLVQRNSCYFRALGWLP
jgi:hypothetical protein